MAAVIAAAEVFEMGEWPRDKALDQELLEPPQRPPLDSLQHSVPNLPVNQPLAKPASSGRPAVHTRRSASFSGLPRLAIPKNRTAVSPRDPSK
eukprot:CAMPEP_0174904330 /NCGR_PEP_ID=MMETSP0167-20121228/48152_1 /TAXON_ID=38298 /ORGANISM="Rhodella maculata, Strain CCMP736" /LENGTH=92 /DNA_ID=CAMNT_0016146945 /DNA_START=130 /DNA_END=406 /DNA_ORIENTATION=+